MRERDRIDPLPHSKERTGQIAEKTARSFLAWALAILLMCPAAGSMLARGTEEDLASGLAACGKLAEASQRSRCVASVRKNAPCARLPREERIECQRAAGTLASPLDLCKQSNDPDSCQARIAAATVCRAETNASRERCIQEQLPPKVPRCDRRTGLERLRCELSREAALACAMERGRAARECVSAKSATRLLKERFNPLDCPDSQGELAARCAARERVRAACAEMEPGEAQRCRSEFFAYHMEPRDCSKSSSERGACMFHLRVLEFCRGKVGDSLESCFQTTVRERSGGIAVNCRLHDLNAIEREYCNARDRAFEACLNQFDSAIRFISCVDEAIPSAIRAAAVAASLLRFGPVR